MHTIDIQVACAEAVPFTKKKIRNWVNLALSAMSKKTELTLRMVESDEISLLNKTYRKKDKPTNVLAFPSNLPAEVALNISYLGDIIICPAVLKKEALEQNKTLEAHWAHIVIHGVLHLLGYDHIKENDEKIMQALEIEYLAQLDFVNPYLEVN